MPKDRNILIFENPFTLSNYLLKKWFDLSVQSIEKKNQFTVALPGGKTPVEFYCKLSGAKDYREWDKTHIFMTDERFVEREDEASNLGMLYRTLLDYVHIPEDNIHFVDTEVADAHVSAERYQTELIKFFGLSDGEFPCFDLMLLGIGEDGHVASLFPGKAQIEERNRLVISTGVEKKLYQRISLSLPVINHARHVILLATGKTKSGVIKRILQEKKEYPARRVFPTKGEILFLLDKDAASELPQFSSYTHLDDAIAVRF